MNIAITPLILTYNEAPNIQRTLGALSWAREIIIIDSGSTDGTLELAKAAHPNVKIIDRPFDNHPNQWNFGLDQIKTEWVLSLDADYVLTPELTSEIVGLDPPADVAGYSAEFRYCIFGHFLRSSVYPARVVLFRRARARYVTDGHTQLVKTDGMVRQLKSPIYHDDRKPLSRWLQDQDRYSKIEAQNLLSRPLGELNFQDRLRRRIFFAPAAMFFYLLFGRGLILDGWPGWYYVAQRTIAEFLLSIRLLIEREKLEFRDGVNG